MFGSVAACVQCFPGPQDTEDAAARAHYPVIVVDGSMQSVLASNTSYTEDAAALDHDPAIAING